MQPILFEACCGSAADAIAAWQGGANRVELNSDLFHGGLTPTPGALRTVKKHAPDLPVMCMVRPREGGFCYTQAEFETMLEDARILLDNGADGIVFGCLQADGTVDTERCRAMLSVIGSSTSVFHRAIDVTPDPLAALDTLIGLGVTRVLTSGGITPENAAWCRDTIGVTMMHMASHRVCYDRSTSGNPAIFFGGAVYPPEDRYLETHAEDIASFLGQLNG